ncbi:Uncharacterized protein PECH_003666 [Penicillium ucsense]|uniref:EKC/KEOPS complex subunit BUD32 n=1 Tax=Penicillium ucsense TaxID=2839758 RepID=A0A8J8WJA8_9EURO|nr:Uncharacterized protein PECM_001834 [Penicillium ucsense]KAF7737489.1 Uncharacterized protein PECH_003666 [Penicillium ucsense]
MDKYRYETPDAWKRGFCLSVRDLIDPESKLAQKYPHLCQIFRHRLEIAYSERQFKPVSLCAHTDYENGYQGSRSDSDHFQRTEWFRQLQRADWMENDTQNRMEHICPDVSKRMDFYGIAGEGTFGSVFLAREHNEEAADPNRLEHYAVKVTKHETLIGGLHDGLWEAPNGVVPDNRAPPSYIPSEALVMFFLTHSDRFPKLDSVYTHDRFQAIVMSPCVDYSSDRQPVPSGDYDRQFPGFTARYMLTKDRKPLLSVSQACKVSAQLLEAMRHLADMNIWHNDFSVNNILVDKNLNAQMIDLGEFAFGLEEQDFLQAGFRSVPFQEYQMFPELALSEEKDNGLCRSDLHDLREECLWKFGTIIYGILHGHWPWDEAPKNGEPHRDLLDSDVYYDKSHIYHRRNRILNEPLPIDENLPQDCKDVLQSMFSKDPAERPSLAELEGYPWFAQWARETQVFERPFSKEFRSTYMQRRR